MQYRFTNSGYRFLMSVLAVVIGTACFASAANAMSIRELRALAKSDKKQGENYVRYYLVGAMEGVLAAQTQAVRDGAKPFICLYGRRLQPSMAQGLFDTELRRNSELYEADMPADLVMMNALSTVYPCAN